jgi:hypothetical protein
VWNVPRIWFPRLLPPNFLASLVCLCLCLSVCLSVSYWHRTSCTVITARQVPLFLYRLRTGRQIQ